MVCAKDTGLLLLRGTLAHLEDEEFRRGIGMSKFDDLLKKIGKEIETKKEDKNVSDTEKRECSEAIQRLAPLEWSKLMPAILAETDGKGLDNKSFFSPPGTDYVTLGNINLVLLMNYRKDGSPYYASYKTFTPNGIIELASINLVPETVDSELRWNAIGLNHHTPFTTNELAEALAMKLVHVYQENLA